MSIKRHDRSTTPYGASVNWTTGAWCIFRRDYVVMTAGPSAPPAEIAALFSVAPRIASERHGHGPVAPAKDGGAWQTAWWFTDATAPRWKPAPRRKR